MIVPATEREKREFWRKVDIIGNACWLWKRKIEWNGYGRANFRGKQQYAHRVAFFITRDRWPYPLCLHNKTCIRSCCNPSHLREGTHQDNVKDLYSPHKYPTEADYQAYGYWAALAKHNK